VEHFRPDPEDDGSPFRDPAFHCRIDGQNPRRHPIGSRGLHVADAGYKSNAARVT